MLEANPYLTPQQVREILTSTAQPISGAERSRQGAGALEPSRALGLALRAEGGPMIGFPLSPEFGPDGVSFCLYDHEAADVRVFGSWDDWSEPGLQAEEVQSHVWCAKIGPLPPGTYSYRFLSGGHRWLYDPDNPRKTPNRFGGFDSLVQIEGRETIDITQ
jgi:hypothetical protein